MNILNIFSRYKRFLAVLVIIVLLTPLIMVSASLTVYSADGEKSNNSWLKGILLIVFSFILNKFVETPSDSSSLIDEQPLIDRQNEETREVMGFYVNWLTPGTSSYAAMEANWQNIDLVSPFWYTVNPDGSLESRYGGYQYETASFASSKGIRVLPLINNNQQNNMILVDPETRRKAVNNIVDLIEEYDYAGVNIDFENLPQWTRNGYTSFIRELSRKLRPMNKLLTISVFPKIDVPLELQGAYDYSALSSLVDRVVIMTYDNHWSQGPAGPIAPLDWVERNIKYTLEYIPPARVLLGVANYGYDWPEGQRASDLGARDALALAAGKGIEISWDENYQSPYFNYWDEAGVKHEVWFESSNSAAFKLDLVNKYNLRGIAIWRLGNAADRFWKVIEEKLR